jgi:signal transduction histidine kinase
MIMLVSLHLQRSYKRLLQWNTNAGNGTLAETLRSSTLKLALLAIAAFGVVVFALIGYVYWSTLAYVRDHADREIAAELQNLDQVYRTAGGRGLEATIAQWTTAGRRDAAVYLLADASLARLAGNLQAWPAGLAGERGWAEVESGGPGRLRVAFETLTDGAHLLIGRPIDDLETFRNSIRAAIAAVSAFLVMLAAGASFAVTRRTVGRIAAINATSRAILQRGPGQRIPLRGTRDEWDQLAHNLNLALGRIEELMAEVKQVSDNVAHDLRTPLTRMRARLEKALERPRHAARDQSLLGDTLAELDGVLGMFTSLLRISQIEGDNRRAGFRTVNLVRVVSEVVELYDAAAEAIGGRIDLRTPDTALVTGDRDLLFDAIANVIDNAIKHGGAAGPVSVEVTERAGVAIVSVGDRGPGIPLEHHHDVFKRFYRLERSRCTSGNGLGLSLVAAVANLHRARIDMLDNNPGLLVRLAFEVDADVRGARADASPGSA